ncbi:MAG TPA: hypothetical protein VLD35_18555, partial [Caldimonas sp.]|nr:hypothetical protein [Caldimonas sp.]
GAPPRAPSLAQAAPEAPSRFKLVGVMAPRSGTAQAEAGQGVALIAVDGKPAKPYAVGARLDSDLVLQSVGLRTASLGPAQGSRSVLLELPALPAPNSGVLPPVGGAAPAAGIGAPVPAAGGTRMQSAIQAAQAAQAAQGLPSPPPPALVPPQAPVMAPPLAVPQGAPVPAPNLPTPGGLPSQ